MRFSAASHVLLVLALAAPSNRSQSAVSPSTAQADAIVRSLGKLPAPRKTSGPTEERRSALHSQLRALGQEGIAALARALTHSDLVLRRNVLFALYEFGHGVSETGRVPKMDIGVAVPALIGAFKDPDAYVRSCSALKQVGVATAQPCHR